MFELSKKSIFFFNSLLLIFQTTNVMNNGLAVIFIVSLLISDHVEGTVASHWTDELELPKKLLEYKIRNDEGLQKKCSEDSECSITVRGRKLKMITSPLFSLKSILFDFKRSCRIDQLETFLLVYKLFFGTL